MIPKVSVIVPIFNVKAYLPRCLDSLCCQTLTEIEIILIDDGSSDGSGEIADRYAQTDNRFQVIHQENRGLSAARNRGIEAAQAYYLMFVDSDDWVDPDFCRIPYEIATEHGVELVIFRQWQDGFPTGKKQSVELPEGLCTRETAMRLLYHGASVVAWNKLYHKRLFEDIRYPLGRVYEDHGTTHRLVQAAEWIWISNALLYHYCYRENSITKTRSRKHTRDQVDMYLLEANNLQQFGYTDLAEELFLATDLAGLSYLVRFGTCAESADRFLTLLRQEKKCPPNASWKAKAVLRLLQFSPKLFDLVCFLMGKRKRRTESEI